MKLIMSIINGSDGKQLTKALMQGGFHVTRLSSTGGFLQVRNATLICGVVNERVPACLAIIERTCRAKTYSAKSLTPEGNSLLASGSLAQTSEFVFGGATVFVLNVEEQKKF